MAWPAVENHTLELHVFPTIQQLRGSGLEYADFFIGRAHTAPGFWYYLFCWKHYLREHVFVGGFAWR